MKTKEELLFAVFATNGDAAIVENDEQAEELANLLQNGITYHEITDPETFAIARDILDFSEQVPPRHIYSFFNECPCYVVYAEDYGD